jgi:hypothetical protein
MDRNDTPLERDVADALRALKAAAIVPPADAAREAALLGAFDREYALSERRESKDRARGESRDLSTRRDYWYLGGFAAAAVLLLAASLPTFRAGRHVSPPHGGSQATHTPPPSRDVQLGAPAEFVIVPGAAELPRMESGTLVRMDVPVSMLPSLGVTPPPGQARAVTADFIVAQDGLPRAVRLVSP